MQPFGISEGNHTPTKILDNIECPKNEGHMNYSILDIKSLADN